MNAALSQREAATAEGIRQLELACLPTSLEWQTWFVERSRFLTMTYGWERALCVAIVRLQKNQITLARMLRLEGTAKNVIHYNSDGYVWGEETRHADEITREAFTWFLNEVKPQFDRADTPAWADVLGRAVEGCFLQQCRLGIEIAAIKRKGYLTLNHSATAPNPLEHKVGAIEVY
jgi:hypothetical protein